VVFWFVVVTGAVFGCYGDFGSNPKNEYWASFWGPVRLILKVGRFCIFGGVFEIYFYGFGCVVEFNVV